MKKIILQNTLESLTGLRPGDKIDIANFMADLVLRNAFKLFLGLEVKKEAKEMAQEFRELNLLCGQRMLSPFPAPLKFPTTRNLRINFLSKNLRSKIWFYLGNKIPDAVNVHSLFIGDKTLIDQCMTFLFAGHETTASSLTFTLLLLGQHSEYLRKIREGDHALALMVYKEALRPLPPAYMLAREAKREGQLGEVKYKRAISSS